VQVSTIGVITTRLTSSPGSLSPVQRPAIPAVLSAIQSSQERPLSDRQNGVTDRLVGSYRALNRTSPPARLNLTVKGSLWVSGFESERGDFVIAISGSRARFGVGLLDWSQGAWSLLLHPTHPSPSPPFLLPQVTHTHAYSLFLLYQLFLSLFTKSAYMSWTIDGGVLFLSIDRFIVHTFHSFQSPNFGWFFLVLDLHHCRDSS
jgi:hypothetical protein